MLLITLASIEELPFDFSVFEILLLIMIATGGVIIVLVAGYFLELLDGSLLLDLYTLTELIIMVIVSHVDRHNPCLFRAEGSRGSIVAGFFFIA